jgi:hypothetical protein
VRPKAATVSRVVIGSPERHAGLAMVALCVHEDATSVHFHLLGAYAPPEASQRKSVQAFWDLVDGLEPPTLRDDRGTAYEPVDPRPGSASGTGSMPGSDRRQVVTGAWVYTPAAPDDATAFFAEQADWRWTLPSARLTHPTCPARCRSHRRRSGFREQHPRLRTACGSLVIVQPRPPPPEATH